MTDYGWWLIIFSTVYTFGLIIAGQYSRRRAENSSGYFIGGRTFNRWIVAFCITGLFSGSTFISIIELSYLLGISAIWYGIAETIQILVIALVMIGPFREKLLVTISGLIGEKYGRTALGISGAITAFAFPMWSVATAIAFASAIHVFTGFSLTISVAFTAFLLYLYLHAGGMWSIAFTQSINIVIFALMFILGIVAFFINPGVKGLQSFATAQPEMFQLGSVGFQMIAVWFGTFLVNVILAQAAFQMALACRTPKEGQAGLKIAAVIGLPFILLGTLFGVSAAAVVLHSSFGLIALPKYLMEVLPAPLVGLFFLGVWACALGWGAPCQFSGATSLGRDVGRALQPQATSKQLIKYTKLSLLLLTGLMILFGLARTEQSAWWNILAWTIRNSATFAPVVAALFWRLATRESVISSMVVGFLAGISWYYLGHWHPQQFFLNIHPVWIGMITNISTLVVITLIQQYKYLHIKSFSTMNKKGYYSIGFAVIILIILLKKWESIYTNGLLGIFLFLITITLFIATIILIPDRVKTIQSDEVTI